MTIPNTPKRGTITLKISSITNAFVNSVIPHEEPSLTQKKEALSILGMSEDNVQCAYCGNQATEWDHLMPLIREKKPTGHITDIYNLIPACGKCNQSKGSRPWREWIEGPAKLSPKTRGIQDLKKRIARIEKYEKWGEKKRRTLDIPKIARDLWNEHEKDRLDIVNRMRKAEERAKTIREVLLTHHNKG